jgi:hypothetical protein
MPQVDSQLVANLKLAKTSPVRFAYVMKGPADGRLFLTKKPPVPPKDIAEAKKELGGGQVFVGRVRWEDDQYVFELAKDPPAPLANSIRAIIRKDTGQTVKTFCRSAADLAAEEGGAPPEAGPVVGVTPAPVEPAAGKGEALKRLNALSAGIKAALAGPNKARVQALFVQANGLIKANDFAQAAAALDQLEALVGQAAAPAASAPPPAAPAAAPPAAPAPDAGKAVAMKRLNALSAGIKAALAGPNKARVQVLFLAVNGAVKNQDFAQATKLLDELESLVQPTPARTGIPQGIVAKRQFLLTRWKQIPAEIAPELDKLNQAIAAAHPEIKNLPKLRAVIERQLQMLFDELQNEIDAAINKGDMSALAGLRARVLKHGFVNHLMANPFVSGTKFQSAILNAIQEVEQRMAG